jgi:hypothetical protein
MTEQFLEQNCVPFTIAKSLKEIGFNEECIAFWDNNGEVSDMMYYDTECTNSELENGFYYSKAEGFKKECTAPLFQQVFDWFDKIGISGYPCNDGSIGYAIHHSKGNDSDSGFDTRKEAQIACIEKMIEIYKEQNS